MLIMKPPYTEMERPPGWQLVFTENTENKLQRIQWTPGLSNRQPFRFG